VPPSALDVDLNGVISIDADGERALLWLQERGATLHGHGDLHVVCAEDFASSNRVDRWFARFIRSKYDWRVNWLAVNEVCWRVLPTGSADWLPVSILGTL